MDHESLKKSGLLEQYVLGLTSRKESLLVERTLAEDPKAQADYESLRREMDAYALSNGMGEPLEQREERIAADYEELDQEMFSAMAEKIYSLVVWRYGLMAACFLLLCTSGYLYRLSETNRSEAVVEKAHHAQDNNAHEKALRHLKEMAPNWGEMKTIKATTKDGTVIFHYLNEQGVVLLDLSHTKKLTAHDAYFVFVGNTEEEAKTIVPLGHQLNLHPVFLPKGVDELKIFKWDLDDSVRQVNLQQDLVASLSMPQRADRAN